MSDRIIAAGCLAFWCGVAIENLTQTPLLVLVGVLAP